ncbi:MAG: hypothetical protein PWR09_882 [Archaeoglobi archaeon]|nr:hypothetical protein [Candidatus Mnemosynella bozhongmuii]MDI3502757.1 hypothetical protein [Archaeoglobi archaeon]
MKRKFRKFEKKSSSRLTEFLKRYTHFTAREWIVARVCSMMRDERGRIAMKEVGERLPEMTDVVREQYSRQEVSNVWNIFKKKMIRSGATFLYPYYAGIVSREEMLEIIGETIENIKRLLEFEEREGEDVDEEIQRILTEILREVNREVLNS